MDLITRGIKEIYKERKFKGKGIEELLFPVLDANRTAAFRMDRYITIPYGISYRNATNESIIRHFVPGTTELITVPRASEKTPIDEELRDQVAVGKEATGSALESILENVNQIIGDHLEGHYMTKRFQAIDTIRTGIFVARGDNGVDLGLGYDHGRDAGNSLTYDFTAGGATMDEALIDIDQILTSQGTPQGERFVIMGSSWVTKYSTDATILERMQANTANELLQQQIFSQQYGNVDGLYVLGRYRAAGMTAPVWILAYTPDSSYVAYKGASAAPFVPATSAVFGSFLDKRFRILRGVDAFGVNGRVERVVGDLVVDRFSENDPITEFIRSQTRHIYICGNVDHTGVSVGTF